MKELVIFGAADIAELAHYYFTNDSNYVVAAFTVDSEYIEGRDFCGHPVVPFEELPILFPPEKYALFVALSYYRLNQVRMEKYLAAKALGYKMASYVSSHATVLNNFNIGENCFILENNTIQPFVAIGHNVTLWSGNHIGHHSIIHDHCFLASHIVVSGGVEIEKGCFIGVNATLRDHIRIGEKSVIGAGALIMADVEPESLYISDATACAGIPSTQLRKI